MTDKKSFGSFIKQKRTEKNFSQKDLADRLFVTESAISKWERGISYPDVTLISDICNVLDISEHELITASTDTAARQEKHDAKLYRRITYMWFLIPTALYLVSLVICLICDLAANRRLTWFPVVFASLLCGFSFIPSFSLFFKKYKLLGFVLSTIAAICLLMLTCALYSHSVFWVPTACFGVAIGYALIFVPIIIKKYNAPHFVDKCKFIISFFAAFVFTCALLISVNTFYPFELTKALCATCYAFSPLLVCSALCSTGLTKLTKAGLCSIICGSFLYASDAVVNRIIEGEANASKYAVNFASWETCVNGNVMIVMLLASVSVGIGLIIINFVKRNHRVQ